MAAQVQSAPSQTPKLSSNFPVTYIIGAALIVIAFVVLLTVSPDFVLFPLWSSIAYPLLILVPFLLISAKVPAPAKYIPGVIVALVLIPFLGLGNTSYSEFAIQVGIFAAMAIGLNIVVGFAGLLDLGYVAFFAVGAYLWGIFSSQADIVSKLNGWQAAPDLFYLFIFIGIILAAITGILLGLPVLRLKGDYLAIVTLGFGEMIRTLVSNLGNVSSDPKVKLNITNGAQDLFGISSPPLPGFMADIVRTLANVFHVSIDKPEVVAYQLLYYFLVLVIVALVVIITSRLDNSPIGRAWTAIREDETAAIAMGVPLVRMKLLAFAMGASFAGAMGVIFAAKQTSVNPTSFSFELSITVLTMVIVGGMGSIRGALFGAALITLLRLQILSNFSHLIQNLQNQNVVIPIINYSLKDWPTQLDPGKYKQLFFGFLLVLMMIFRPAGLIPAARRKLELQEALGRAPAEKPKPTGAQPEGTPGHAA